MRIAQKIKIRMILPFLNKEMRILDLGCGDMWLSNYLKERGYGVSGFSLSKPADIVGDVKSYKFKKNYYDAVLAIEMVEHVDCYYPDTSSGLVLFVNGEDWFVSEQR